MRTLARVIKNLFAAVGAAIPLVGFPVGLVVLIGWPLPHRWPTTRDWIAWGTSNNLLTDRVLLDLFACALWLLWAWLVSVIVREMLHRLRRMRLPRPRLPAHLHRLAGAVVGVVVLAAGRVLAALHTGSDPVFAGLTAAMPATTADPGPTRAGHALRPGDLVAVTASPAGPADSIVTTSSSPLAGTPRAASTGPAGSTPGTAAARTTSAAPTYTVAEGDTLWDIAGARLGDATRWPEIYALNHGQAQPDGYTLQDPDEINVGWIFTLPHPPSTAPPPHQPTRQSPHPRPPAATPPAANPPSATPPSEPQTPSVSPDPSSPEASAPSASGSSAPSAPHSAASAGSGRSAPGISVPGGWLTVGLAAAVVAAAGMVWQRRRHRYVPTPITHPVLDDPDLTAPLDTLTGLRHAIRRVDPDLLDHLPDPGPSVHEYLTAPITPALPPVGPAGVDLAGIGERGNPAGLGLTGPGAPDAARALLAATLSSGHPDDPVAAGQVIVPAATLATLLGVSAVDLGPLRRLAVAAGVAEALSMLDEQIIARTRILSDYDAADVAALRAAEPLAEPVHQLLFITDAPEQRWQSRLATTARLGSPLEIATVVIGAWPYGATLSVAADGTITGLDDGDREPDGDGGRIAVLDTGTAVQMLTMLREAHGDAPPTAAPSTVDQPAEDAATPPTPGLHDTPSAAAGTDGEPAAPSSTPTTPAGAPTGTPVRVRILGPAAVLNTDGTAAPELRAKSLELLVYLAVHRRGASREDILEAVFGDVAQRRAPAHLYTCASTLRGVIRTAAAPASATAAADHDATDNTAQRTPDGGNHAKRQKPTIDPVVNTDGHYQLDPALVTVDWWTVLDHYTATATATNDADRLTHLRAAITAAGGGLAEGANYDWIDTDREDTRRHLIKIYAQAAALSTDTDPHQARAYSDLACGLDPLSDELARRAMRAAARVGDTDAITRRLAALRRELDQAGIDLDPGTEDLAVDLLRDLTNP